MDRVQVSSSNILSIGYDPSTQVLEVEFISGAVYQYFNVPEAEFESFLNAESKGRYLNANIKHYPYTKC